VHDSTRGENAPSTASSNGNSPRARRGLHSASAAAAPGASPTPNRGGVNVGYLNCSAAGGVGFVFGSSRALNCLFTRTDGAGERYEGTIRRGLAQEGAVTVSAC